MVAPAGFLHREQSWFQRAGSIDPIPSTGLRCFAEPKRVSGEKMAQVTCAQLLLAVGFKGCRGGRCPVELTFICSRVEHNTQSYFYGQ
jgi:hypothetical protein